MAEKGKKEEKKFVPKKRKRRPCIFCSEKKIADYKNSDFLRKFVSDRGKILPRRSTGCCALHQRMIVREIKKARHLGLVPYTVD